MLAIAKTFEFCASHRLYKTDCDEATNQRIFGKCSNPNGHGHNYRLEVIVSGTISAENSMIVDASQLDKLVSELIIKDLDHKSLNHDVSWLAGANPTSEVLVEAIWQRLEPAIKNFAANAKLDKLVLHETSRIYVVRTA